MGDGLSDVDHVEVRAAGEGQLRAVGVQADVQQAVSGAVLEQSRRVELRQCLRVGGEAASARVSGLWFLTFVLLAVAWGAVVISAGWIGFSHGD